MRSQIDSNLKIHKKIYTTAEEKNTHLLIAETPTTYVVYVKQHKGSIGKALVSKNPPMVIDQEDLSMKIFDNQALPCIEHGKCIYWEDVLNTRTPEVIIHFIVTYLDHPDFKNVVKPDTVCILDNHPNRAFTLIDFFLNIQDIVHESEIPASHDLLRILSCLVEMGFPVPKLNLAMDLSDKKTLEQLDLKTLASSRLNLFSALHYYPELVNLKDNNNHTLLHYLMEEKYPDFFACALILTSPQFVADEESLVPLVHYTQSFYKNEKNLPEEDCKALLMQYAPLLVLLLSRSKFYLKFNAVRESKSTSESMRQALEKYLNDLLAQTFYLYLYAGQTQAAYFIFKMANKLNVNLLEQTGAEKEALFLYYQPLLALLKILKSGNNPEGESPFTTDDYIFYRPPYNKWLVVARTLRSQGFDIAQSAYFLLGHPLNESELSELIIHPFISNQIKLNWECFSAAAHLEKDLSSTYISYLHDKNSFEKQLVCEIPEEKLITDPDLFEFFKELLNTLSERALPKQSFQAQSKKQEEQIMDTKSKTEKPKFEIRKKVIRNNKKQVIYGQTPEKYFVFSSELGKNTQAHCLEKNPLMEGKPDDLSMQVFDARGLFYTKARGSTLLNWKETLETKDPDIIANFIITNIDHPDFQSEVDVTAPIEVRGFPSAKSLIGLLLQDDLFPDDEIFGHLSKTIHRLVEMGSPVPPCPIDCNDKNALNLQTLTSSGLNLYTALYHHHELLNTKDPSGKNLLYYIMNRRFADSFKASMLLMKPNFSANEENLLLLQNYYTQHLHHNFSSSQEQLIGKYAFVFPLMPYDSRSEFFLSFMPCSDISSFERELQALVVQQFYVHLYSGQTHGAHFLFKMATQLGIDVLADTQAERKALSLYYKPLLNLLRILKTGKNSSGLDPESIYDEIFYKAPFNKWIVAARTLRSQGFEILCSSLDDLISHAFITNQINASRKKFKEIASLEDLSFANVYINKLEDSDSISESSISTEEAEKILTSPDPLSAFTEFAKLYISDPLFTNFSTSHLSNLFIQEEKNEQISFSREEEIKLEELRKQEEEQEIQHQAELQKQQAETRQKEEQRLKAEEEARQKEEQRLKAEEEARQKEEQRLKAEEEARQKEEQRLKAEEEARQKEEQRLKAEEEARQKEEQRLKVEEEIRQKEEQRLKAEEEARQKEEQRLKVEEEIRQKEEQRLKTEEEARQKEKEEDPERFELEVGELQKHEACEPFVKQLLAITFEYKNSLSEKDSKIISIVDELTNILSNQHTRNQDRISAYYNHLKKENRLEDEEGKEKKKSNMDIIQSNKSRSTAKFVAGITLIAVTLITGILPGLAIITLGYLLKNKNPINLFETYSSLFKKKIESIESQYEEKFPKNTI